MTTEPQSPSRPDCGAFSGRRQGFTLIEVMMAVFILGLGIAGTLVTLQMAFAMVEMSRDQTLASQFLQAEIETLRMKNWNELSAFPPEEQFSIHGDFGPDIDGRYVCTRRVETVRTGADLKRIVVQAHWKTRNGVARELAYETRISKNGINDYYYRSLPPENPPAKK